MVTLKAYFVYECENELNNDFVKAITPGQAKMKSYMTRDLFGVDNPITDLNVRRVPYLDNRSINALNILNAGYATWCDYPGCWLIIYDHTDAYRINGEVYCKKHGNT